MLVGMGQISTPLMTQYEYQRMVALEASGVGHEAAKQQVYAERGASGAPVSQAPQGAPMLVAAKPIGVFGRIGIWIDGLPFWAFALGCTATGAVAGAAAFTVYRQGKRHAAQAAINDIARAFGAGAEETGVLTRSNPMGCCGATS
jgi:hypothetical protein